MARTPQRTLNQDLIVTSGDAITGDDSTGAAGGTLELEGGDAAAASGAAAGSVILHPGVPDGAGAKGIVNIRNNTGDNDTTPILQITSQGTNAEDIRLFVGTRDPNGTVSGNPGDVYVRHNGTSSTVKVNTGAADANTTWTDLGGATAAVAGTAGSIYENATFYVDASDRNSYSGSGTTVTDLMGNGTSGTATNVLLDNGNFLFWGAQVWVYDDSAGSFTDESEDFLDSGTADWPPFPGSEAVNDAAMFGWPDTFTSMTVSNASGTAGVGGVVAWEYWSGAAWTALSGLSDGTSNFTAGPSTGQVVSWTLPTNWALSRQGGSVPLYYVRARITTTYTTNPVYSQGRIGAFTDERITFTKSAAIDNIFSGGGTLIAFIQPRSDGNNSEGRIADTTDSADEGWFLATISDLTGGQQIRFQRNFDGSAGGTWTSDNITDPIAGSIRPVRLGNWNCVAVSYDDGNTTNNPTMYVNGEEITNTENTAPVGTAVSDAGNSLLIGNRTDFARTFDGHVGVVMLFDRILTLAEIRAIYNVFGRRYGIGQVGQEGGIRGGQRVFLVGGRSTGSNDQDGGDILIQGGMQDGASGSARAGDVYILGGELAGTHGSPGRPGNIVIASGEQNSSGGGISTVSIFAGDCSVAGFIGQDDSVLIHGMDVVGASSTSPGGVTVRGGHAVNTGSNRRGGNVILQGGQGDANPGGDIEIRSGGQVTPNTAGTTGAILISTDRNGTGGTDTGTGDISILTTGLGATGANAGNIIVTAGSTTAATGNNPGDITVTAGSQNASGQGSVTAGSISLIGGNNAGTTTSPGGSVTLTGGNQTSTATSVSNGGDVVLNGGTCAKNAATARAGNIDINAGAGTGTSTTGGSVLIDAGVATGTGTAGALTFNAGASAGAVTGGIVTITAGTGGTTGTGGSCNLSGGSGGSTSGVGGTGRLSGGNAQGGGSNGGAVTVIGGSANTSGTGGLATLSGGNTGTTGVGGGVQINGAGGGSTSGAGGAINIDGGDAATGAGGLVAITTGTVTTSGAGGAFSVTTGNGAGAGNASGGMTFTTGTTSDGNTGTISFATSNATGTDRAAGDITFDAGDSTGTAEGGDVSIITGAGGTTGSGGDFAVSLGSGGSTSGTGGGVAMACGGSNGASAAGGFTFAGGDAAGTGTGGAFEVQCGASTSGTGGGVTLFAGGGVNIDSSGDVRLQTHSGSTAMYWRHKTARVQATIPSSPSTTDILTIGTLSTNGRQLMIDLYVTGVEPSTDTNIRTHKLTQTAYRSGGTVTLLTALVDSVVTNGTITFTTSLAVSGDNILLRLTGTGSGGQTFNFGVNWTTQESGQ